MQEVCDILEELVRDGILRQYALGGATAAGLHGEPLATRDIDVFVSIDPTPERLLITLDFLYSHLAEKGFTEFEEEGLLIHGFPVQFLTASSGLELEAMEQAITLEWDKHQVRVMRAEHLAALAIDTGRPKDRARLVYFWELPSFDKDLFTNILARHRLEGKWKAWGAALGLIVDE